MADIKLALQEYVATANNPEYGGDYDVINSKFPELKDLDPELLKEYVATANNPEYGGDFDVINSKFPELALGKTTDPASNNTDLGSDGGLLELPESGKDVVKNLINIDNNTTYEKDIDLKQSILERYFEVPKVDLSKIEGAKTIDSPMGAPVDWSTIKFEDAATASEDQLKEHFGEQKYDLYKKYQQTGDLNIEDIPKGILPAFKEVQDEETKKRSRFLKEDQVRNNKDLIDESFYEAIAIDEDVRGLYSTDFIEDYSEQEKLAQKETRSIDFGGMVPVDLTQKEKKELLVLP